MNEYGWYLPLAFAGLLIAAFSQVLLKKSALSAHKNKLYEYLNPLVIVGYTLMLSCTLISTITLRVIPLSIGTLLESGSYIFVLILSRVFFKEKITKNKIIGTFLIAIGITITLIIK